MHRWPLALVATLLPAVAAAQAPHALVLEDVPAWGISVTQELAAQGITYDVVDSATFGLTVFDSYTMMFVTSCQSDALYDAWNLRAADVDFWVSAGGFAAIHGCTWSCGAGSGTVFPQPPGGNVSWVTGTIPSGVVLQPLDPLMLAVPAAPTGTDLAHLSLTATGNVNDIALIDDGGGRVLYFRRDHGLGNVAVGTLTYEYGYSNGQDAGIVLVNEVTWGAQVGANCDPTTPDSDLDGVSDDCDRCPGFDDNLDDDGDNVPDGCDVCPGFNDGDNPDGDAVPTGCDNCPVDANDLQEDADLDLVGDACDQCPGFDDALDDDADGAPNDCDVCPGFNDNADADADGVPNDCDNCPAIYNDLQEDADADGVGDVCDLCPGFDDGIDGDLDTIPDDCDICPGFDDRLDGDADGVPSDCDNCPLQFNDLQEDADADGNGDVCDRCAGFDDNIDTDADSIPDDCDVCPGFNDLANPDGDLLPTACDNCPDDANDDQMDSDSDGSGDVCDPCPGFDDSIDADGDGRPDQCDNCVATPNPSQADTDGDGPGDACDVCPLDAADDSDSDGFCDSDDRCPGFDDNADSDADGRPDDCDNCPTESNANQADQDADGAGNPCDCEPEDVDIFPGQVEVCDGIDNNCSGSVDDVTEGGSEFWLDKDGDGFGDSSLDPELSCDLLAGFVDNDSDCDDSDDKIHVGAKEECDGVDNDCDGEVDDPSCGKSGGCGCSSAPQGAGLAWLVGLSLLALRRRRAVS